MLGSVTEEVLPVIVEEIKEEPRPISPSTTTKSPSSPPSTTSASTLSQQDIRDAEKLF